MTPPRRAVGVLALALALAACSGPGEPERTPGEAAATTSTTTPAPETTAPTTTLRVEPVPIEPEPAPPPRPDPTRAPRPPTTKPEVTEPPGGQALTTLRGQLTDGVEPGCVVLRAEGGGTWLLVGPAVEELPAGGRVRVSGYEVAGLLSTCQQGRPFRVVSGARL